MFLDLFIHSIHLEIDCIQYTLVVLVPATYKCESFVFDDHYEACYITCLGVQCSAVRSNSVFCFCFCLCVCFGYYFCVETFLAIFAFCVFCFVLFLLSFFIFILFLLFCFLAVGCSHDFKLISS